MNNFKELRKLLGLSQKDLADKLFVNQTAVSQWELGKTVPSPVILLKMCEIFNTTTDYLLGRTDKKSPRGEPELDTNSIEYALYGEARELDEDEKKQLLELVKLMRKKRRELDK